MKRRMKAAALLLAALMVLSMMLTACSSQTESSVEYVIRLGHSDTEDNLLNVSLQDYAEWVNEQTEGRVVIRIYPNEQLGDNSEMAQQLITGELDAMMMPQGVEAKYAPKIATLGLPFLFTSYEDRKSTRLNSSHPTTSRMPSSA